MIKKILIAFVVLLAALLIVLAVGKQAEPFAANSASAQWLSAGDNKVKQRNFIVSDSTRKTEPQGEFQGSDSRKFELTVWFPENLQARAHPLLVYSHGFSSMRTGGQYLAEYFASHGYIVLASNYPSTNIHAPGGPRVQDVVNQPDDIKFLLDQLLYRKTEMGQIFADKVNRSKIGAMGISLGGMTTTLVSFHPEKHDPRIKAAVSIAGPAAMFAETFYQHRPVPYMMIGGDIDALVSYQGNADLIPERVANSWLVTLKNASHTGFADPAKYLRWMSNPDSIGCDVVTEKLQKNPEERWDQLLGTEEQGIIYNTNSPLCEMDPLPEAMNPLRQHMLTTVAIAAFFKLQFSNDINEQNKSREFLAKDLSSENSDITVLQSRR